MTNPYCGYISVNIKMLLTGIFYTGREANYTQIRYFFQLFTLSTELCVH